MLLAAVEAGDSINCQFNSTPISSIATLCAHGVL
jgi:hypothetical protein